VLYTLSLHDALPISHTLTPLLTGTGPRPRFPAAGPASPRPDFTSAANSRGAPSAAWTFSRSAPPRSRRFVYSSPASLANAAASSSEEHTSELQSPDH